jgi:hypothetical protein
MTSHLTGTQIIPVSANMGSIAFEPLAGDWPVLDHAVVDTKIIERILDEGSGQAIDNNSQYLSLGYFFIHTELLTPHKVQRQVDQEQVRRLIDQFNAVGVHRTNNAGVVIGLGPGWFDMLRTKGKHVMIDSSSPHLGKLANSENGPIGEIICGGHRTAAIKAFNQRNNLINQNFWLYNVFIPSK